ncbi:MAG TPA: hypothetical protein VMU05_25695 [Dongiaceae bacterium]|nr:hypothetical protein [Dongiaceae bacterium]
MSTQPVENLELRALEQRRQIHATAEELKGKISAAKEKLDVSRNLRQHLFAVAMTVGAVTLLVGTLIARRFER